MPSSPELVAGSDQGRQNDPLPVDRGLALRTLFSPLFEIKIRYQCGVALLGDPQDLPQR